MNALNQLRSNHAKQGKGQRLGQFFVNRYHCGPWPSLFYEQSDAVAISVIRRYLVNLQYTDALPPENTTVTI